MGAFPRCRPTALGSPSTRTTTQKCGLILANSDGSERRIIARLGDDDGYQRWSPDSTQIAFIGSTDEGGFGTYVYDLETGETRFVTHGRVESWIDDDHILVS